MKTPRDVLLGSHQDSQHRLDAIRKRVVAQLTGAEAGAIAPGRAASGQPGGFGWLQLLRTIRWHAAGLTAVWLLIAALRLGGESSEAAHLEVSKAPSPRKVILALRENRRQLLQSDGVANAEAPPVLAPGSRSRRSCVQTDWAYA